MRYLAQVPVGTIAAFAFLLIAIVERIATLPARIRRKRAKELRNKAADDRERELIERSQTGSDDGSGTLASTAHTGVCVARAFRLSIQSDTFVRLLGECS